MNTNTEKKTLKRKKILNLKSFDFKNHNGPLEGATVLQSQLKLGVVLSGGTLGFDFSKWKNEFIELL